MAVPGRARAGFETSAARDGAACVERRGLPGETGRSGSAAGCWALIQAADPANSTKSEQASRIRCMASGYYTC